MTMHDNELTLLVRGLPAKDRAKLMAKLKVSDTTLRRWMRDPRHYVTLSTAPIIKEVLDRVYKADHDINALSKPVQIRGRKRVTA